MNTKAKTVTGGRAAARMTDAEWSIKLKQLHAEVDAEKSAKQAGERIPARKLYLLTDGHEIFARKEMTEIEAHEENEVAQRHTGGNVSWCESKKA